METLINGLVQLWIVTTFIICAVWVFTIPYQMSDKYLKDIKEARKWRKIR